jgi:hypothetical protein
LPRNKTQTATDKVFFKGYSYQIEKLMNVASDYTVQNIELSLSCITNIEEEFKKSKTLFKSSQSKMIKHCIYRIKQRLKYPKTRYDRVDIWVFTKQLDNLIREAFNVNLEKSGNNQPKI